MESQPEARTVSIEEWARALGIGRAHAYRLAQERRIPGLIVLGRRYVVSKAALEKALSAVDGAQELVPA